MVHNYGEFIVLPEWGYLVVGTMTPYPTCLHYSHYEEISSLSPALRRPNNNQGSDKVQFYKCLVWYCPRLQ